MGIDFRSMSAEVKAALIAALAGLSGAGVTAYASFQDTVELKLGLQDARTTAAVLKQVNADLKAQVSSLQSDLKNGKLSVASISMSQALHGHSWKISTCLDKLSTKLLAENHTSLTSASEDVIAFDIVGDRVELWCAKDTVVTSSASLKGTARSAMTIAQALVDEATTQN